MPREAVAAQSEGISQTVKPLSNWCPFLFPGELKKCAVIGFPWLGKLVCSIGHVVFTILVDHFQQNIREAR